MTDWHPRIDTEFVRDLAISLDDWFAAGVVVVEFDVSYATAQLHLRALLAAGILERRGVRAGTRYRYARDRKLPADPTRKPRGEPRLPTPARGGDPVPHTRPRGPSGKPGGDKKRSERGVRVVKRAAKGHS